MDRFLILSALSLGLLGPPAFVRTAGAQTVPTFSGLRSQPGASFSDEEFFGSIRFDKLEWNTTRGPLRNDASAAQDSANIGAFQPGITPPDAAEAEAAVDSMRRTRRGRWNSARWDMEAFIGTDYDKLFLKSEGFYDGRSRRFDEAQVQILYSRLISYYFDLQFGIRHDIYPRPSRTYAAIGIEGLAPGFFEVDATAYLSNKGEVSGTFTTWYDLFITNRLVLQPRIDVKTQLQRVPDLNLGSGITDLELGARFRYEFTREFAPYVGVVWDRKVGGTAWIAKRNGDPTSSVYLAAGLRLLW